MERIPVSSSNISSIGYDLATSMLEVEFKNGAVYQYAGVPPDIHEAFMAAESKGSFHHLHIKRFPYVKL